MKFSATAVLLLLASTAVHVDAVASPHDSKVLSACAGALFKEAAEHSSIRNPKVAYVLPEGEASREEAGRARLSTQFKGRNWEQIAPALANLHARLETRWRPPSGIAIPGMRVRIKNPRTGDFGAKDFYFSFWPPGYDATSEIAFVLAEFGPTPHGVKAACHLRREGDAWVVEQKWVESWL